MKTCKVFIVPHTHWDREWYMEREKSRMMLIDVIDELLYLLKSNDEYVFMLDGQTLLLEDYFTVRKDRKDELINYIKAGRVSIGPWYILPDEFLVSGEAHIRNFLIGDGVCKELGGKMTIGYLPDSFGHPSQMPQILTGLGMHEMVFWRGLGPDVRKTELRWTGLDGSVVLGINLPFSYGIGACMPVDADEFVTRLNSKIAMLQPLATGDTILIMNGVDHVTPQRSMPENIEYARKKLPEYNLVVSGLQEYLVEASKNQAALPETSGELRSGYKAYLLGGTISTRMYLKQENFKYETLLERYAEPLSVLAGIFADTAYPDHEITHAWKILLSNQPHDSICGCSVDPVHDEMMLRYRWTHDVVQAILDKAGNALFERKRSEPGAVSGSLVVFNPHLHSGTELVTVELTIDERLLRKVNYETGNLDEFDAGTGKGIPDAVLVRDQSGNQVAGRIISVDDLDDMVLSLHTQPEMFRCKKVRFSFSAKDIPALSFSEYNYEFLYDQPEHPAKPAKAQIENDFFMVRWDAACSALTVEDKRTGFVYEGLNTIEDSGDAGDEYTFSKPRYDTCSYIDAGSASVTTSVHAGSARMVIDAVMRTPEALDADRLHRSATLVDVGIQTCVELTNGIARIDIRTEIDNRARDHRIRVLFPLGGPCAHSSAEGIFSVDDRPATPADPAAFSDWIEPPSTNPQKSFVSALSADKGLSIANRGLPEYELYSDADKNGVLALTLLRGVGWLSRPDLSARKGNGGWTLATPKAQCLGSQVFEYSIIPHKDSWVDADIPALAHSFAVPPMAFSGYGCISGRKIASIVSTNAKHLVLSSVKKSVSGTSYIIRFWNESAEDIDAELSFGIPPVSAWLVDLAETRLRALTVNGMKCSVHCGAWKIVSIELRY